MKDEFKKPPKWESNLKLLNALSNSVKRGYTIAKAHGYTGSSLDYAMAVMPDIHVTDIDECGNVIYDGPANCAPSVDELLSRKES